MATGVLVDANVLYSRTNRDWLFLLRDESGGSMFKVFATEDIIAETVYRLRRQKPAAPGSLITRIHDRLVESLDGRVEDFEIDGSFPGTDANDAHIHAAAVACGAGVLLTADSGFVDLDEGVADSLPYEVHHPDSFFILVDDSASDCVRAVICQQLTYWYSRRSEVDLPGRLRLAGCPEFAERVRQHLSTIQWTPPISS